MVVFGETGLAENHLMNTDFTNSNTNCGPDFTKHAVRAWRICVCHVALKMLDFASKAVKTEIELR